MDEVRMPILKLIVQDLLDCEFHDNFYEQVDA